MAQNVNNIARKFGMALVNAGTKMVRSAYNLKPKTYMSMQIAEKLKPLVGLTAPGTTSWADGKYSVVPWETWEWIKDLDLIDKLVWESEVHDCDNFAFHFNARASAFYRLNSCGVAFGSIFNDKGERIGGHAFNIITVENNGELEFILYEPMNDNWAKIRGRRTRLAHGWTYEPNWIMFF